MTVSKQDDIDRLANCFTELHKVQENLKACTYKMDGQLLILSELQHAIELRINKLLKEQANGIQ